MTLWALPSPFYRPISLSTAETGTWTMAHMNIPTIKKIIKIV
jgi:hypothetical protein